MFLLGFICGIAAVVIALSLLIVIGMLMSDIKSNEVIEAGYHCRTER